MVQDEVLKLLAYASVIPKYGIAVKSIQTLGRFMEGAEEATSELQLQLFDPQSRRAYSEGLKQVDSRDSEPPPCPQNPQR